jgi:hypothetical protein
MKLRVKLGSTDTKEVSWFKNLEDFPKLIKYLGRNYEWVFYDIDPTGKVDQVLTFSMLMTYNPNYGVTCDSWTDLFGVDLNVCECGAAFSSFSWDHLRYCKKWSPW